MYRAPTKSIGKKLLFSENTMMSNKHFVLALLIKEIPFGFPRVAQENALFRFGRKLVRSQTFNISFTTLNLQKR